MVDEEPAAAWRQAPLVPVTDNRRTFVTPASDGVDLVIREEPVAQEATLSRHEPTLSRHEPTLSRHEPTLSRHEPALSRHEPALSRHEPALTINTPRSYDYPRAQPATPCSDVEVDELEADEIGVEAVELNDAGEAEEEEEGSAEAGEAEEEEEAEEEGSAEAEEVEEEEVALNLEPVRIRKIIYWKDVDSGDLYQYLPDDEVGERVGGYINGIPVIP
jgi:translation initiation factor IF-2